MKKLHDFVDFNPRVSFPKGKMVPFVPMTEVTPGVRYVRPSEERVSGGSGSKFAPGDTLFARITPCLQNGKIAQYAGDSAGMGSTEFFVLRAKPGISDASFVYYFSQSEALRGGAIKSMSGASGRQRAVVSSLEEFPCEFPPLPEQRRIASILSAYDDLIEVNLRRIKILEEMARAIYREWFLEFRFPGSEGVRIREGVPEGWGRKKLGDVCHLTMGQSPKSEFYNDTRNGIPFHQGVTNFGDRFPTDRLFCSVEGRMANAGDILFSVRAPVGRMNIADKQIILGRGLSAIRHKQGFQTFLWEQLRDQFYKEDLIGNGAIFAAVTKDEMQNILLICPPEYLLCAATAQFEPIHEQVDVLSKELTNLRQTRDILLPRLIGTP